MTTCPICGKDFRLLSTHIVHGHKMDLNDFRGKYPGVEVSSKEFRENMSRVNYENMSNPESRKKISESVSRVYSTEEGKEMKSKAMKKVWETEGYKEKMYEVHVRVQSDKDLQRRKSKALKKTWANPERRNYIIQRQREEFGNPENLRKFKTVINGEMYQFRSTWEVKVANYLTDMGIPWEYEVMYFPYIHSIEKVEKTYHPDFYVKLGNKKVFLEVKPNFFKDSVNEAKLQATRDAGYKIYYVSDDDIVSLESFKNRILTVQRLSESQENLPK